MTKASLKVPVLYEKSWAVEGSSILGGGGGGGGGGQNIIIHAQRAHENFGPCPLNRTSKVNVTLEGATAVWSKETVENAQRSILEAILGSI